MNMRVGAVGLGLLGGLAVATAVAEQQYDLRGGFLPDPTVIAVEAVGSEAAAAWVRGCPGWVAAAPAARVTLHDPVTPLRVYAVGPDVAGVVVAGPDGLYRCAQAAAAARLEPMLAGEYAIWPAARDPGQPVATRVLVSERDLDPDHLAVLGLGDADGLQTAAAPAFGRYPVPPAGGVEVVLSLAGGVPAEAVVDHPGCVGALDPHRPDVVVEVAPGTPQLALRGLAAVDTTLVVVGPDGGIHCNDDSFGLDPALLVAAPAAGEWAVWLGIYGSGSGETARLAIGREWMESAPQTAGGLDPAADPAAGVHRVDDGAGFDVAVVLSGGDRVDAWLPSCDGWIDPTRPDVRLELPTTLGRLDLRVHAEDDTTLVVLTPDGQVHCDDDSFGFDPALAIRPAPAGDYAVWVGVYGGDGGGLARLQVGTAAAAASDDNPFQGRTLSSAAEAFFILLEEEGLGEVLAYDELEETDAEGFVLHGVTLSDPMGDDPPLTMDRLRVAWLDLVGLAETGVPDRFALTFEGVDYRALAALSGGFDGPALPALADGGRLDLALSLLPPPGLADRRDLDLSLELADWLGLALTARLVWPDGIDVVSEFEDLPLEALALELRNLGFLGAAVREQAVAMGTTPDAIVAMALEGVGQALAGADPDGLKARLLGVLAQALADVDRPGVLRLSLAADRELGIDDLLLALEADQLDGVMLEMTFHPLP